MLYLRWALTLTLACVLAWWRTSDQPVAPLARLAAPPSAAASAPPCVTWAEGGLTLPTAEVAQHHAVSTLALPNGGMLAFWFAGSREGATDVALLRSQFDGRGWSAAQAVLTPKLLSQKLGRTVRKLGNPSVWLDAQGQLHMAVVNVTLGGWAMSRIAHLSSADLGVTFDRAQDWITSPWLNISTLVRSPPLPLSDGSFLLPAYHELAIKRPELLHISADGRLLSKRRMAFELQLLQPALATGVDPNHVLAVLRSASARDPWIHQQESSDGGLTWTNPHPLSLPNPDAYVALASWPQQRLWLMVYNPETTTRKRLAVAWRAWDDPEGEWHPSPVEINEPTEASYPSLVVQDGYVEVLYTQNRQAIAHRRLQVCPVPVAPGAAASKSVASGAP
ncbi:MAG: exo-alpha-sialidase [Leptothrix ochracea]|uniref:exo-alpha-sialidase n=1 Tax=Leptothrix ochracea TaxID=735331 RepID=UPI0034E2F90B